MTETPPPQAAPAPAGAGEPKQWMVALLLCILPAFIGVCGVHRFYVGKIGTGVLMLLTVGGCGIWQLIDIIMIAMGNFTDAQGRPLAKS